ncbi:TetR/AcrR family transcriptional regulator [Actinomyces oris]|uniref:TetR/AcrR family transcriptional regulator n=1 Tax=Actinomyces oris TaxID=544580 RepID=UPI0028D0F48C|nr:TetR/AcrR family transcriptional regulator [Actinomyces oris]
MARPHDPRIAPRLLDLAADSLLNRGLHGLSLRPLASNLGVSPRTLLYHFGSKEKLIVEAIRHLRRRQPAIRKLLEDPPTASTTASESISEMLGRLWDEARQPQSRPFLALYFELAALSVRDPATYRPLIRALDDDWIQAMRGQLTSLDVQPQRMEAAISTALAGYRGALLQALTTDDWKAADEAINCIIEALRQQIS